MLGIFILSGILYYTLIRYVLIHELDEALSDYKHKIGAYVSEHHKLPEKCYMDETLIDFYLADKKIPKRYYLIERLDPSENTTHKYRQLEYSIKIDHQNYYITIAKELEGTKMVTRSILFTTLGLILLIIIISVLVNLILLKRLWRPFYNTMNHLEDFKIDKEGDIHFEETDIDEFALLNKNLEQSIKRARNDYRSLKEFTENAAHEMQTPVSIIRSKLDLLIQGETLSEKQTQAIISAYAGVKRLKKLNQSLLLLAKIENKQFYEQTTIHLDEKVLMKIEQFKEIWKAMDFVINKDIRATIIKANDALMEVLLNNLFSNAANHNTAAGTINIRLIDGILTIANTGKPSAMNAGEMFKRFNKGDQSSHSNGLGLSIIKETCTQSDIDLTYFFKDGLHQFELDFNKIKL